MRAPLSTVLGSVSGPEARRALLAVLFVSQFVVIDVCVRGVRELSADPAGAAHVLATCSFWAILGSLSGRGFRRALVALWAAGDLVAQAVVYRYYHAAIDVQILSAAVRSSSDIWPVIARGLAPGVAAVCVLAAVEYALLAASERAFQWSRSTRIAVLCGFLVTASLGPGRVAARELTWNRGIAPGVRVGALPSTRPALPSVLFVLTESVRAADYCSAHGGPCPMAPEVDALVADRFPLREMRSVSSYTAVSVGAILNGSVPTGAREAMARAPLLFDFMKAVRGASGSLAVAYWSSQTDSLFERSDLRTTLDSFVTVEDLVGHAVGDEDEIIGNGVDRLLAARVGHELTKMAPPFVAMVHLQGTHAPYFVDDRDAPFRPFTHVVAWSGLGDLHNAYLDAIHEQDKSIAAVIRAFVARVGNLPYVVVFTSDHGEAFGDHGAIHHGQNLYEEQIHVPAWIATGNGALDSNEMAALRAYEHAVVTHLDLLPTLLDVEGVPDTASRPYRRDALGRSLIRPFRHLDAPIPATNCTGMFRCPLDTWGLLSETRELAAQPWDAGWRCADLAGRAAPAGDPECQRLERESLAVFPTLPNGAANR